MWVYKTKRGKLSITENSYGRFILAMDNLILGSYKSPEAAAEDVAWGFTGSSAWDSSDPALRPQTINDWQKG